MKIRFQQSVVSLGLIALVAFAFPILTAPPVRAFVIIEIMVHGMEIAVGPVSGQPVHFMLEVHLTGGKGGDPLALSGFGFIIPRHKDLGEFGSILAPPCPNQHERNFFINTEGVIRFDGSGMVSGNTVPLGSAPCPTFVKIALIMTFNANTGQVTLSIPKGANGQSFTATGTGTVQVANLPCIIEPCH